MSLLGVSEQLSAAAGMASLALGALDRGIGDRYLLNVALFTALWAGMYLCLCWTTSRSKEWNCRIVTLIHAVSTVVLLH